MFEQFFIKRARRLTQPPDSRQSENGPPRAEITAGFLPGSLRAEVYLPDATNSFYRGTRFDWFGVIGSLTYAGHDFFPAWFQRTEASVQDFVYAGVGL